MCISITLLHTGLPLGSSTLSALLNSSALGQVSTCLCGNMAPKYPVSALAFFQNQLLLWPLSFCSRSYHLFRAPVQTLWVTPPPPLGLPSKLQRCSIQGPPLLPIHVHISLVWILSHLYLLWVVTSSLVLPPLVRLYTHLVKGQIHPQNVQLQPHHWSTPKSSAVLRAS